MGNRDNRLATFTWVEMQRVNLSCTLFTSDLLLFFPELSQDEALDAWRDMTPEQRQKAVFDHIGYFEVDEHGRETEESAEFREKAVE